jgi:hypothetical protein
MKMLPRQILESEVEQGITQRDQFDNDDFALEETLVREPHQNSLDGKSPRHEGPVITRIRLIEPKDEDRPYWSALLTPLKPHLAACGRDTEAIDLQQPKILLIEDFGTTGLLGAVDKKDTSNFSDFWRRFGVSHKSGKAGGRWGLGKLVFSSASQIGTFFGLTVRDGDPGNRYLMGQAVLAQHKVGGVDYAPHIFFAQARAAEKIQLPVSESAAIDEFVSASGITRTTEPGLSIAIACVRQGLTPEKLLPYVLGNYFFPVLRGNLKVEIGDKVVDKASFDTLANEYGNGKVIGSSVVEFIRSLPDSTSSGPSYRLSDHWLKAPGDQVVASSLSEAEVEAARVAYAAGELVGVRAPLTLKRKDGQEEVTHVDAFVRRSDEKDPFAIYVRGSITIPGEAKTFRGRGAFGALIAEHPSVTDFLGDAENPAHTRWSASSGKLAERWRAGGEKVKAIRNLLNELHRAVADSDAKVDEDIFIDILSVPKPAPAAKERPDKDVAPDKVEKQDVKAKDFKVIRRDGGFIIRGLPGGPTPVPFTINVRMAYDVRRGNPFSKFKPFDFDAKDESSVQIQASGSVSVHRAEPNLIAMTIDDHTFECHIYGFDKERDLIIKARAK